MSGTIHLVILLLVFALACLGEALRPARAGVRDDRRLVINFGLGVVAMLTGLLPWIGPMAAAALAQQHGWGLLNGAAATRLPITAQAAAAVMLFSLASYGLHRIMHRSHLLWRWHRVHHADAHLDFSTGFRTHPGEAILASANLAIWTAVAGLDPLAVAGALIMLQALDLASHSNVRLPAGVERRLGWVLATPAIHCRHHSARRSEHDSNFGNGLVIWDRLFGTYSGNRSPQRLGLD